MLWRWKQHAVEASEPTLSHLYFDTGAVMKVDMATGKALWATNTGLTSPEGRNYAHDVAVTGSGDVIVSGYLRSGAGWMAKYDGITGTKVWVVNFEEFTNGRSAHMNLKVVGDTAYVTGAFEGANITKFGTSPLNSCDSGGEKSAFVASFDVSDTTAPTTANWIKLIGCGAGGSITVSPSGDSLFVAGALDQDGVASVLVPATGVEAAKCTMAGGLSGYLAKLNPADGTCVWAKDAAMALDVATDGTHVWTASSDDESLKFSETVTLAKLSDDNQIFAAKYDAADGTGLWAARLGGAGSGEISSYGGANLIITPNGPVVSGYSESHHIEIGDVKANNLQHQRSSDSDPNGRAGDEAMLIIQLSKTDKSPSCISKCDSGKVDANMEIAMGSCYVDGSCVAHGEAPTGLPCFECNSAVSQVAYQGPNFANHCYMSGVCVPRGAGAPNYMNYNSHRCLLPCPPPRPPTHTRTHTWFCHRRKHR